MDNLSDYLNNKRGRNQSGAADILTAAPLDFANQDFGGKGSTSRQDQMLRTPKSRQQRADADEEDLGFIEATFA